MITISVIVPVYNEEKYIEKCLLSLINQNISDYEIICIDDKSTDDTLEILNQYAGRYSNIKLIENEMNMGLSSTRNKGILAARGEYILFVDSDDWLIDSNTLSLLYQTAKRNNAELVRYGISIDGRTENIELMEGKQLFSIKMKHGTYKWESVRNFVSRNFLLENNLFFDSKIYGCEDLLFSTNLLLSNPRSMEIDRVLYFYNKHEGSITKSHILNRNVYGAVYVFLKLLYEYRKQEDIECAFSLLALIEIVRKFVEDILQSLEENLETEQWEKDVRLIYEAFFSNGQLINNDKIYKNWERIREASKIYIYGAGKASMELRRFTRNQFQYSGVIVTKNSSSKNVLGELTIMEVVDKDIDRDALILVAVSGKVQKEIKETLDRNGYKNILLVGK